MDKYIFNDQYFKNSFLKDKTIGYKDQYIAEKCNIVSETFRAKRSNYRLFDEDDYRLLNSKVSKLLLLDVKKLNDKLATLGNVDFLSNERLVLYTVIKNFKNNAFTIDDLMNTFNNASIKRNKVLKVLDTCLVKVNDQTLSIYKKSNDDTYCVNLSNLIKYTQL